MTTATLEKERRTSRIDLRMTDRQKSQIEDAARISGVSVSQWAIDRLLSCARKDIAEDRLVGLPAEAFDQFVNALEQPTNEQFASFSSERTRWE